MWATEYPEFTTVTCFDWIRILENNREKEIIIESMRFLVREHPEDYKYSSARFYLLNEKNWDFLTHIDE